MNLSGLIEKERLPAGREDLAEPLVAHSQQERTLVAMADGCATKGYSATTIADICEPGGVSRATFYELFKDKEDCFHAAMEVALADAMGRIVSVYSPDKPWVTMVRDTAAEFLDLLASRPAFARMALVEAPASGDRAFELYASGKKVLQSLLDRGRDHPIEEEAVPASAGRADKSVEAFRDALPRAAAPLEPTLDRDRDGARRGMPRSPPPQCLSVAWRVPAPRPRPEPSDATRAHPGSSRSHRE